MPRRSAAAPARRRKPARAPVTVAALVRTLARRFQRAGLYFGHGTDNPTDEAAWLVASTLGIPPQYLSAATKRAVGADKRARIAAIAAERIRTRKPLAYLLNEAWFAGESYYVDERVLVPRSHLAEFIGERFAPWIEGNRVQRILDLCTGSGCIAIAAAHAFPHARVDAGDISAEALAVARINVERHGVTARVHLAQSDLYAAFGESRYDVIVSNPPYVQRAEMGALPPEYRHEPELGLVAGTDGLDLVVRILADAAACLNPGGILLVETGNSAIALQEEFPDVPFTWLTTATGDESVFLLNAEQLAQHRKLFVRAARMRA